MRFWVEIVQKVYAMNAGLCNVGVEGLWEVVPYNPGPTTPGGVSCSYSVSISCPAFLTNLTVDLKMWSVDIIAFYSIQVPQVVDRTSTSYLIVGW